MNPLDSFHKELRSLKTILYNNLEKLENKEKSLDNKKPSMIDANTTKYVLFIIGGQKFHISTKSIFKHKESLFFHLIYNVDLHYIKDGIYIERNPSNIEYILNYMKHGQSNLENLTYFQLNDLKSDANYYSLPGLENYILNFLPPEIVSYKSSKHYYYSGYLNADTDVNSIKTEDKKGITLSSPSWIIFELNNIREITEVKIKGYSGNVNVFSSSNGSNAVISTSEDGKNFKEVGKLGSLSASLTKFSFTSSFAKYVKFSHSSYMGFSYVEFS